ncbi:group II intron reverse transcriptase/maturase, partial [Escherichia albertii]|nr:group II intron reverse transcriptase/maturase [Escherichia albertii]
RRRVVKNVKRNSLFVSFTPAASKSALKAMRREIKATGIRKRVDLSIEQIAKWINPKLNGWINYYGRYTCSELYSVFRYINKALVRWGRKKYKMLSRYKTRASKFLEEMAKRSPQLFAHW